MEEHRSHTVLAKASAHAMDKKNGGTVRILVGDTNTNTAEKIRREPDCARGMAAATDCAAWRDGVRGYKTLAKENPSKRTSA